MASKTVSKTLLLRLMDVYHLLLHFVPFTSFYVHRLELKFSYLVETPIVLVVYLSLRVTTSDTFMHMKGMWCLCKYFIWTFTWSHWPYTDKPFSVVLTQQTQEVQADFDHSHYRPQITFLSILNMDHIFLITIFWFVTW